jgi:hypothetical protein
MLRQKGLACLHALLVYDLVHAVELILLKELPCDYCPATFVQIAPYDLLVNAAYAGF